MAVVLLDVSVAKLLISVVQHSFFIALREIVFNWNLSTLLAAKRQLEFLHMQPSLIANCTRLQHYTVSA